MKGSPSAAELRRTVLHRALHRLNTLMGGERELVLFTLLIAAGLPATALNWPSFLVGAVLWFGCIGLLRAMGKSDPQMSHVYRRSLKYQPYYAPRSTPYRTDK